MGEPMRSLTIQSAVLIALAGAVTLASAQTVVIKNELTTCVRVQVENVSAESNVVSAVTTIQLLKPIGECGCLSALASYVSSVNRSGVQQTLQQGLIGMVSGGEKTLVLATDPALVENKKVTIQLSCAGPL